MSMHGYHSEVTGEARSLEGVRDGCADAAASGMAYTIAGFGAEG